jgi:hypothetical protein
MVTAFVAVLQIDPNTANFFLESAQWDIEAAVVVCVPSWNVVTL